MRGRTKCPGSIEKSTKVGYMTAIVSGCQCTWLLLHEPHCRECYGVVEITGFSLSSGHDWLRSLTGRIHDRESGLSN